MLIALLAHSVALASELPATLQAVLDQAETADLPTSPLEQKALEGLAKGVDESRITSVLQGLLSEWQGAEQLLGERASGPDRAELVPAAAAALRQGAPSDAVIALSAAQLPSDALWTLSDVLYAGVSAADAERMVRAALANRQPDMALRELPEATRLLVATDGPAGAAQTLTTALNAGNTPLAAVTDDGPGRSEGKSKSGWNADGNGNGNGNGNNPDHSPNESKGGGKAGGGKAP